MRGETRVKACITLKPLASEVIKSGSLGTAAAGR